jgi:glycosyltransferase involved in cell wall biosynthesis
VISFLSVFPPYRGGIANFSDYLYRELDPLCDLRCFNFRKLYPNLLFPGKTQYDAESNDDYALPLHHGYNPLYWASTGKRIGRTKPKALIISYWHPFFIPSFNRVIDFLKRESPDTRIICLAHNIKPHDSFPMGEQLTEKFISRVDHFITLSEQTSRELVHINPKVEYSRLFHPIYDADASPIPREELRKKYGLEQKDKVVLFFGLVRPYKGLDVMIEALNELDMEGEGIRAVVAGEFYEDQKPYVDMIRKDHRDFYRFEDRFLTNEEVAEVFKLSDLLMLPYKSASQSGILANAINFGIPVLASDHPGLTEHITDGETGSIFANLDGDEAARKIADFFGNEALQDTVRENIMDLKEKLSWSRFSEELMKILES